MSRRQRGFPVKKANIFRQGIIFFICHERPHCQLQFSNCTGKRLVEWRYQNIQHNQVSIHHIVVEMHKDHIQLKHNFKWMLLKLLIELCGNNNIRIIKRPFCPSCVFNRPVSYLNYSAVAYVIPFFFCLCFCFFAFCFFVVFFFLFFFFFFALLIRVVIYRNVHLDK